MQLLSSTIVLFIPPKRYTMSPNRSQTCTGPRLAKRHEVEMRLLEVSKKQQIYQGKCKISSISIQGMTTLTIWVSNITKMPVTLESQEASEEEHTRSVYHRIRIFSDWSFTCLTPVAQIPGTPWAARESWQPTAATATAPWSVTTSSTISWAIQGSQKWHSTQSYYEGWRACSRIGENAHARSQSWRPDCTTEKKQRCPWKLWLLTSRLWWENGSPVGYALTKPKYPMPTAAYNERLKLLAIRHDYAYTVNAFDLFFRW